MVIRCFVLVVFIGMTARSGLAQDQADLTEISGFVSDTAVAICDDFLRAGGEFDSNLEAEIELELVALVKRIGGFTGNNDLLFDSSGYIGVLREELSGQISENRICRLTVWNDLRPAIMSLLMGGSSSANRIGVPIVGGNSSVQNPLYIGAAIPSVNGSGQIRGKDVKNYFVFDVIRLSECKITTSHDSANMWYVLAESNREVMERDRHEIVRRLFPGSYYFVVEADRPTYYDFEVFCQQLN